MSFENAVAAALDLRDALAAEVESARGERPLLKKLDTQGLFARAAERGRFLAESARLERELAAALARGCAERGIAEVSVAAIQRASPDLGRRLGDALADVKSLAGALHEIDRLNATLARRALSCVRGYVDALAPAPRAYGPGARAPALAVATISSRG
jgi:hypothetical protein